MISAFNNYAKNMQTRRPVVSHFCCHECVCVCVCVINIFLLCKMGKAGSHGLHVMHISLSHPHVSSENSEIRKSWVWTQSLLTFSWNSWRMSVGHVIQIRSLWEKSVLLVLIILFQPLLQRCNAHLHAKKHIVCFLWFWNQNRSSMCNKQCLSDHDLQLLVSSFVGVFSLEALQSSSVVLPHKNSDIFWGVSSVVHIFLVLITTKGLEAHRWLK